MFIRKEKVEGHINDLGHLFTHTLSLPTWLQETFLPCCTRGVSAERRWRHTCWGTLRGNGSYHPSWCDWVSSRCYLYQKYHCCRESASANAPPPSSPSVTTFLPTFGWHFTPNTRANASFLIWKWGCGKQRRCALQRECAFLTHLGTFVWSQLTRHSREA